MKNARSMPFSINAANVVLDLGDVYDELQLSIIKGGETGTSIALEVLPPGTPDVAANYVTPRDAADAVASLDLTTRNGLEVPTTKARKVKLIPTGLSGAMTGILVASKRRATNW